MALRLPIRSRAFSPPSTVMVGNRCPFSVNSHAECGSRWQKPSRRSSCSSKLEPSGFATPQIAPSGNSWASGDHSAAAPSASLGDTSVSRGMSRSRAYRTMVAAFRSAVSLTTSFRHPASSGWFFLQAALTFAVASPTESRPDMPPRTCADETPCRWE